MKDLNIGNIATVAGRLSYGPRDNIILNSMDLIVSASVQDLVTLASSSYDAKGQIMLKGEKFIASLTSVQLGVMLDSSGNARLEVAQKYMKRLSDLNAKNAAAIASHLSYGAKNTFIYEVIGSAPALTVDDVITLAYASYDKSSDILTSCYAKLSDLSVATIVTLSGKVSYGTKDSMILTLMDRLRAISSAELVSLAGNAYQQKAEIILKGSKWISHLSTDELISLIRASNDRGSVAQRYLDKLSDLSASNAARVSSELSYGAKNVWITAVMAKFPRFSTSELITFSGATYQKQTETLTEFLDRLSDESVENALRLAGLVSYGSKNTIIQHCIGNTDKISASNLVRLADASYQQATSILIDNIAKIADFTATSAGTLADRMSYGSKDEFLLKAVGLVIDLSSSNLAELAKHAYQQQREILEKGLRRLSENR